MEDWTDRRPRPSRPDSDSSQQKNSRIFQSHVFSIRKMVWIICPQMTLSHFPTKKKINFFFTVMYLVLGKWCGFFVHK